jgi:hypothetical protein
MFSDDREQFLALYRGGSMAIFQSALRLLAKLLFAMLFLYSPSYAGEGTAIETFTSQNGVLRHARWLFLMPVFYLLLRSLSGMQPLKQHAEKQPMLAPKMHSV